MVRHQYTHRSYSIFDKLWFTNSSQTYRKIKREISHEILVDWIPAKIAEEISRYLDKIIIKKDNERR